MNYIYFVTLHLNNNSILFFILEHLTNKSQFSDVIRKRYGTLLLH